MKTLENPLEYYCSPNEATPAMKASCDIQEFIAWLCYDAYQYMSSRIKSHFRFIEFIKDIHASIFRLIEDALRHDLEDVESSQEFGSRYASSLFDGNSTEYNFSLKLYKKEDDEEILIIEVGATATSPSFLEIDTTKQHWFQDAIAETDVAQERLFSAYRKYRNQSQHLHLVGKEEPVKTTDVMDIYSRCHPAEAPEYVREKLTEYQNTGGGLGHFLTAVLENDLSKAIGHADSENLAKLPAIVAFVYNCIDSRCWGSKEIVKEWKAHKGREGLESR